MNENAPPDRSGAPPSPAAEPLHDTRQVMEAMRNPGRPGPADWQALQAGLRSLTPRTYVTRSLLVCNLAVFAAMVLSGVGPLHPSSGSLIAWGAEYGPLTGGGQWWRLWTSTFVHIGFVHLACNLLALWQVGDLVERLVGSAGFLLLYTLSGILGSLATYYWNPLVLGAGASGAIFGVYGALLASLFQNPGVFPRSILTRLTRSTVLFVGCNVVYGLQAKGVGLVAHLGGLAGGVLCGLILARPVSETPGLGRARRNWTLGAAGAAFLFAGVLAAPRPDDIAAELLDIARGETRVEEVLWDVYRKNGGGALSNDDFAHAVEEQVLPEWSHLRGRLAKLPAAHGQQAVFADLLDRYLAAMQDTALLLIENARTNGGNITGVNARLEEAGRIREQLGTVRLR
jgi:membrane associated rhomboid family serine protease